MNGRSVHRGAWLAIAVMFFVQVLIFWGPFIWWKIFMEKMPSPHPEPKKTLLQMKKFHITGWDGGEKKWEVEAEQLSYLLEQGINVFSRLSGGKIYDKNAQRWKFEAEQGEWRSREKRLVLFGKFRMTGLDEEDGDIYGKGLEWDYGQEIVQINNPFHVEIKDAVINAARGEGNIKGEKWMLYDVALIWKKSTLRAGRLIWDTGLKLVYADTPVELKYKNGRIKAGGVIYDAKGGKVVFQNGTELIDKKDGRIVCPKIFYFPDEDRFVTEGVLKVELKI
ncbi:MAG: LPS export ABC transporter periplasmic protein LptC [Bacillota bacterium]